MVLRGDWYNIQKEIPPLQVRRGVGRASNGGRVGGRVGAWGGLLHNFIQPPYQSPPVPSNVFYARYPFLEGSRLMLQNNGISVDRLIKDPLFVKPRQDAIERILEAIERGDDATEDIVHFEAMQESDCMMVIASSVIARMMVSSIKDDLLFNWYAHYVALTEHRMLMEEDEDGILDVALHFEIEPDIDGETYKLQFTDYLKHSARLKGPEWKLINRGLDNGQVSLTKKVFIRMLMETIRLYTLDKLHEMAENVPEPVLKAMKKEFQQDIKKIRKELDSKKAEYESENLGEVTADAFPPCVVLLIERMRKGDNLSHEARFAVVSFLHTIGMGSEDILKFFGTSPDFDVERSRYQIEHITGKSSSTEYTPPECKSMKGFAICPGENKLCAKRWMSHPLTYYRIRGKDIRKQMAEAAIEAEKAAAAQAKKAEAEAKDESSDGPNKESDGQSSKTN